MLSFDVSVKKNDADDWNMSKEYVKRSWVTCLQQVLMNKEADDWNMYKEDVNKVDWQVYSTAVQIERH